MSRIAEVAPTHCSGCFQQMLGERHVDFEVCYDGPVIPGAIPYSIDDLIVCEKCLRDAGRLIGLGNVEAAEARAARAEAEADDALEAMHRMEARLARVRGAFDALGMDVPGFVDDDEVPAEEEVLVDPAPEPEPAPKPKRARKPKSDPTPEPADDAEETPA